MKIDKLIKSLYQIVDVQADIKGVMVVKNQNPSNPDYFKAKISNFIGTKELKSAVLEKEIDLKDFPELLEEKGSKVSNAIRIPKSSDNGLSLRQDVYITFCKLNWDGVYYGHLVFIFDRPVIINKSDSECMQTFSDIISMFIMVSMEKEKQVILQNSATSRGLLKDQTIAALKSKLEEKDEKIKELEQNKQELNMAEVKWDNLPASIEELWVTVQGYKKGEIDPSISHWKKITNKETFHNIECLVFPDSKFLKAV